MSPRDLSRLAPALRAGAGEVSGAAHSPQNFAPAGFVVPQAAQGIGSGAAHPLQNFAPREFSVPQLTQRMAGDQ